MGVYDSVDSCPKLWAEVEKAYGDDIRRIRNGGPRERRPVQSAVIEETVTLSPVSSRLSLNVVRTSASSGRKVSVPVSVPIHTSFPRVAFISVEAQNMVRDSVLQ